GAAYPARPLRVTVLHCPAAASRAADPARHARRGPGRRRQRLVDRLADRLPLHPPGPDRGGDLRRGGHLERLHGTADLPAGPEPADALHRYGGVPLRQRAGRAVQPADGGLVPGGAAVGDPVLPVPALLRQRHLPGRFQVIDRRTLIKALGAGASVSIAGGAIAGCTDRPTGSDRDPNVVRLWGIWASDADVEAEVVEAFTAENPDITVEVSQVPSNGEGDASRVIPAARGRAGPDVDFMHRFNTSQVASLGLLEPIDGLIEEHEGMSPQEYMSGWVKFATDELFYDGHYYGLPMDTDTRGMYVNLDLADEAGVDRALLDPTNGPLTHEQIWEPGEQGGSPDERGSHRQVAWIPGVDQAGRRGRGLPGPRPAGPDARPADLRADVGARRAGQHPGRARLLRAGHLDPLRRPGLAADVGDREQGAAVRQRRVPDAAGRAADAR